MDECTPLPSPVAASAGVVWAAVVAACATVFLTSSVVVVVSTIVVVVSGSRERPERGCVHECVCGALLTGLLNTRRVVACGCCHDAVGSSNDFEVVAKLGFRGKGATSIP